MFSHSFCKRQAYSSLSVSLLRRREVQCDQEMALVLLGFKFVSATVSDSEDQNPLGV